jgi:hypothetical protein
MSDILTKKEAGNILTKGEFLTLGKELKCEYVPVPELKKDGIIKIRELTGENRDALEKTLKANPDGTVDIEGLRSETIALAIVNEDGTLMFSKAEVQELGKLSGKVLMRIYSRISDLCGLGQKEMDEIEKNSKTPSRKKGSSSD